MNIKGYTHVSTEEIKELGITAYLFEHNKTKAPVLYLSTPEDDNKVFCIGFRTTPVNDKGIPHILEHCVLNGSRKFPVKEPFVELIKGSLNTFINAMTYNDKTVFPVASRNDKDFQNLMDVYLDAVFYPNLRKDAFIMQQEGWHYELNAADEPISFKGVVFNEMKGAYSQPERYLDLECMRTMLPHTTYACESGGFPAAIPDLSYEEFCDFHAKYYHPSNSRIFFYGNGDIEKHLTFLDEEYLKDFDYLEVDSHIDVEAPFEKTAYKTCYYPASGDDLSEKAYLSFNTVLPPQDAVTATALAMVSEMFIGSADAPLRKALLKEKIGNDISGYCETGIQQPFFSVICKNAREDQRARFEELIYETAREVVANGFDKKLLEGTLNSTEFAAREADFGGAPKGLVYGLSCFDTWLYDGNPTDNLKLDYIFSEIRKKAENGYMEKLLKKMVLCNPHCGVVTMLPDPEMAERLQKVENERLAAYKASLTKEEIDAMVERTKAFIERQSTPDSPEALRTIPLLKHEDLDKMAEQLSVEKKSLGKSNLFEYITATGGIDYVTAYFDMKTLAAEELPYFGLYDILLTQVDTDKRSYTELDNEINIASGGISTANLIAANTGKDGYTAMYTASTKFMPAYQEKAVGLLEEVLLHSDLSDKNRIKEALDEVISQTESRMARAGHQTAASRALSHIKEYAAVKDAFSGLGFYFFLKDLQDNYDAKIDEALAKAAAAAEKLFTRENCILLMTTDEAHADELRAGLKAFGDKLPEGGAPKLRLQMELTRKNEGLTTSGQVQFVAKVGEYKEPFCGSMNVLGSALRTDYLWTNIRVKGGAYGAMQNTSMDGIVSMVSYRDPNLKESLKVYDEAAAYMKAFQADEREVLKYIIGTVSDLSSPLTPSMKGSVAARRELLGTTAEMVQKQWDEVLATTLEDLHRDAEILAEAMGNAVVCVQGAKDKILANADLFDEIKDLP